MRKRNLLAISQDRPRRVYQTLAIDEFGELAERKRAAAKAARDHGHQMDAWHRRKNDQYGRWDAWCTDCNAGAVVCTPALASAPLRSAVNTSTRSINKPLSLARSSTPFTYAVAFSVSLANCIASYASSIALTTV